jgi:hypothetical protein
MRFMIIVKANKDSEAGVLPDEKILTEMGKFNEELVKAGVMLVGEGLQPSSKGARAEFERAASLTRNARERELLLERARACALNDTNQ